MEVSGIQHSSKYLLAFLSNRRNSDRSGTSDCEWMSIFGWISVCRFASKQRWSPPVQIRAAFGEVQAGLFRAMKRHAVCGMRLKPGLLLFCPWESLSGLMVTTSSCLCVPVAEVSILFEAKFTFFLTYNAVVVVVKCNNKQYETFEAGWNLHHCE